MNILLRSMTAVYLLDENRILLLYRVGSRIADRVWTGTAGGHFEEGELNDPRACVLRELSEETGLTESDIDRLALRYVTLRLKKGEIRQNYYYFAALKDPHRIITSNEGQLEWFNTDCVDDLPMPHSAKPVLLHYLREGHATNLLYGGMATEDGVSFTPLREF